LQLLSKYSGVHWDFNSQCGSLLGSVWVHSLTPSYILGSMKCDSWASLLAYTFASPCLGLELKARVVTYACLWIISFTNFVLMYAQKCHNLHTYSSSLHMNPNNVYMCTLKSISITNVGQVFTCPSLWQQKHIVPFCQNILFWL
jgi:hypothetical protein